MHPSRPTLALALAALALATIGCRERAPAPGGAAPAAPGESTPDLPATPPADPAPAPPGPETLGDGGRFDLRFGLALAADGDVAEPVLSYAAGDAVCLAVRSVAGTAASELEAAWFDEEGNELGRTTAAFRGAPPRAGLCLPGAERLPRRTYRLDLAVDGVEIDSAQFTLGDLRQRDTGGGA